MHYNKLRIRKLKLEDSEFLFNLRNEEAVRLVSLNSNPISLDTHSQWFQKKLESQNSIIFISEVDSLPIGQTRYDLLNPKEAEVSIAVTSNFRGKGYGTEILKRTAKQFFQDFPGVEMIYAFINLGNEASLRSFAKAGYRLLGKSDLGGLTRNQMILSR